MNKGISWSFSKLSGISVFAMILALILTGTAFAGNGYMGGNGQLVDDTSSDDDSDNGKLFGDLYKILRYQGTETFKLIPEVDDSGNPVIDESTGKQALVEGPAPVGGEPVLSEGYGYYANEVVADDGTVTYELATAPYPSQCVQPVADYSVWGDIWSDPTKQNKLPLVIIYDANWESTECEVGQLEEEPTVNSDGTLNVSINEYFIEPGGSWQGTIYCDGILWTDLIDEVDFGRLNLSRAPEAVIQASFDEAISTINNARKIELDAAGRLLITTDIYEEFATADDTGEDDPVCTAELITTVTKAIDSPLENLALYTKLMRDGHLVTPGDEREPIDRSDTNGIPLWKILELEDGPSTALRPTIDIDKMREFGLASLVDVSESTYYTYYQCYDASGSVVECVCLNQNGEAEACADVEDRELIAVANECPEGIECDGPFTGIITNDGTTAPANEDFDFAASFLAAATDKTSDIGMDMVVYLNSILDLNKVIGYSEYDENGDPVDGAIDYTVNPIYFNFGTATGVSGYCRDCVFANRGQVVSEPGGGSPGSYNGNVTVLQSTETGVWTETDVPIVSTITFDNIGLGTDGFADGLTLATDNILGFTQMADDDLSVIEFIHTYQIPGLR